MVHTRPRLLFLESLPTISGGQAVLLDLAHALCTQDMQYDLWALLPGEGPLADRLRALGVNCRFAPVGRYSLVHKTMADAANYALRFPWLSLVVWRLIRTERIDLVYANSSRTFVWGSLGAALAGRPILWHQHSVLADGKSLALLNATGRLKAVRRIIAVSAAAAANLTALAGKTVVVSNGVDMARFKPDPAAGSAARQALGLPLEAQVIGIVGDLIKLKGQNTFLEAARRVGERLPSARFVIVGAPRPDAESQRYAAELRQQAAPLDGRVIFAGQRSDIPAVLNALDILVVASTTETAPLVLLEALACGAPVVSTPVGRAPELLADRAAGRLFPIGDAGALAQALLELLAVPDLRGQMGRHGRLLAEQRFPLARALDAITAIIAAELPGAHANLH